MNAVLVDSSVWIAFFRGRKEAGALLALLDSNMVCVNDLILAELLPALRHSKEGPLAELLSAVAKLEMDIDWDGLIRMRTSNLRHGINRVGLPDLLIAQNAIQAKAPLFSLDGHFGLMRKNLGLKLFENPTLP